MLSVILDTSQMFEGVNSMPYLPLGDHDQAENVLVEASLAEYKQGMYFFTRYLTELNVNLFIVESIFQFPLELLFGGGPDNAIFFGQVVRNARIAHFHQSFVQESFDPIMKQEDLLFSEVKALCDKLNVMVQTLAFGIHHSMLPPSYWAGHADIDYMLDRLAQTSDWVNMAERNPAFWQQGQQILTEEQSRVIHFYRRKFGLEKSDLD